MIKSYKQILAIIFILFVTSSFSATAFADFTFGTAGDFSAGTTFVNNIKKIGDLSNPNRADNIDFFMVLGDLSYTDIPGGYSGYTPPESGWCQAVKDYLNTGAGKPSRDTFGETYPFQVISGNHEDDVPAALIDNFTKPTCLPNRMTNAVINTSYTGTTGDNYGKEYYFDYPSTGTPLARFIQIGANLNFTNGGSYSYSSTTSPHFIWLSNAITSARNAGIPWIIVTNHENCISTGTKSCSISQSLFTYLTGKDSSGRQRADLILEGHDHNYQRSKQLACGTDGVYDATCVKGTGGSFTKGNGAVLLISGTGGNGLYTINTGLAETNYFEAWSGSNINPSYGFTKIDVSPTTIRANFVPTSGTFADSFTITSGPLPSPTPTPSPTVTTSPTVTPTPTPTPTTGAVQTLITSGSSSVWKYLANGVDMGTTWRLNNFDDNNWLTGPAKLGYSSTNSGINTVVSYGPDATNKYTTTYFRKSFNVTDPRTFGSLTLGLMRDDGAVVYINGTEVYRDNMPTGTISYSTRSSTTVDDLGTFYQAIISPSNLVSGNNVLGVEIHQASAASSDISLDAYLTASIAATISPTPSPTSTATATPTPTPTVTVTASPTPTPVTGSTRDVIFTESSENFMNPERGFSKDHDVNVDGTSGTTYTDVRGSGSTLTRTYIRLDNFKTSPISQTFLTNLSNEFSKMRQAKIKTIIRFTYNYDSGGADATETIINNQLAQLKPILEANQDVIAQVLAGFVGAWGEWHSSSNFNTGIDGNGADFTTLGRLYQNILNNVPASRSVALRYPAFRRGILGTTELNATTAFNGSASARSGFHNDCFLADTTDEGTFNVTGMTTQQVKDYMSRESRYIPMTGETCAAPARVTCTNALAELESMHWSALNASFDQQALDILSQGGCYTDISRRLGYRFVLKKLTLPTQIVTNTNFSLHMEIANVGFARMYNARPFYLVFENKSTGAKSLVKIDSIDPRKWEPTRDTSINIVDAAVPANLAAGSYKLYAWMPDAAPALQPYSEYSIQLADLNTWNATTGYNYLTDVDISSTATTCSPSNGDLDSSGKITTMDLTAILGYYGTANVKGDLNCDGKVNMRDISVLIGNIF